MGINWWWVDSRHKESSMRKVFPCYDVVVLHSIRDKSGGDQVRHGLPRQSCSLDFFIMRLHPLPPTPHFKCRLCILGWYPSRVLHLCWHHGLYCPVKDKVIYRLDYSHHKMQNILEVHNYILRNTYSSQSVSSMAQPETANKIKRLWYTYTQHSISLRHSQAKTVNCSENTRTYINHTTRASLYSTVWTAQSRNMYTNETE